LFEAAKERREGENRGKAKAKEGTNIPSDKRVLSGFDGGGRGGGGFAGRMKER
jgi:hypothetical protein